MKRKILKLLVFLLMAYHIVPITTIEASEEISVNVEKEIIYQGEDQSVVVETDEIIDVLDASSITLELENSKMQEKSIVGEMIEGKEYRFYFNIDKSFGVDETWKVKKLKVQFGDELIEKDLEAEFKVIPTTDVHTDESSKSKNSNTMKETLSDYKIIEGNGVVEITATISDDITKVAFPTWTVENGQDDMTWEYGKIEGNKVSFTVDMKDYKYKTGEYETHIYTYAKDGNANFSNALTYTLKYSNPSIKNVKVNKENGKFIVTADVSGYHLTKAEYPTWTTKNGQDDLTWQKAKLENNKLSFTVEMKNHKYETGNYQTHIYLYDALGNKTVYGLSQEMQYSNPQIKNVKVSTENGKYTVTADAVGYQLTKAEYPTWTTKNGQDDLTWQKAKLEDNQLSFTVEMKDHKYETGNYQTHIYLYDALGNRAVYGLTQEMQYAKPQIKNVKVSTENGKYTVTADAVGYRLTKAEYPTWTTKNGQDDLTWQKAKLENSKISFTVDMKDHKYETGNYQTHIYLYDALGNQVVYGLTQAMQYAKPQIKNVVVNNTSGMYSVSADVSGYNISKVVYPTWTTKNGQDDITWQNAKLENNKISFTVDMKDHKYETGEYQTHIYVYDGSGEYAFYPLKQTIRNNPPVIKDVKVSDITSQGYLITCTVTDDYALDRVEFPTWSSKNGQDDLTWQKGAIYGNTVTYRVYTKDHKYDYGSYETHIYAYDRAGQVTVAAVPTVNVPVAKGTPGWSIKNGDKLLYDANGVLVGQGLLVIDISEHNGNINWTAVKNSGVDAVILRSGYGYCDDYSQMDRKFKTNITELNRLGIPYGIYHFSYATKTSEGALEAKYLLKCLKAAGARPTLPIYYDLEYSSYVGQKNGAFYTELTKSFANVIKQNGYKVGVYANYNWWTTKLTDASFKNYEKWVAHYGTNSNNSAGTANPYWHANSITYRMWQYSSCGSVSGISGRVDMNIRFK